MNNRCTPRGGQDAARLLSALHHAKQEAEWASAVICQAGSDGENVVQTTEDPGTSCVLFGPPLGDSRGLVCVPLVTAL